MVGRHGPSRRWAAAGLWLGLGGPAHGLWTGRFRAGNREAFGRGITLTLRLVADMPVDAAFLGRRHPSASRDGCLPALEQSLRCQDLQGHLSRRACFLYLMVAEIMCFENYEAYSAVGEMWFSLSKY